MLTKPSKNPWTETSELDNFLQEMIGCGEREFFQYVRIENDPWATIEEVLAELDSTIDGAEDFKQRCEDFMEHLDESLITQLMDQNRDDEIDPEPKYDYKYSNRQFNQDKWGIDPTMFVKDYHSNSRKEWRRSTGTDEHLRMLTEWGNFSFDITEKNAKAKMRVHTNVRQGVPFLSVGSVNINMHTGVAKCYASGCKFSGQLRYNDEGTKHFDKEYAEFQVMRILQHLGDHTLKNPNNYWTPIIHVKRFRDDETYKWATRAGVEDNRVINEQARVAGLGGAGAVGFADAGVVTE